MVVAPVVVKPLMASKKESNGDNPPDRAYGTAPSMGSSSHVSSTPPSASRGLGSASGEPRRRSHRPHSSATPATRAKPPRLSRTTAA